MAAARLVQSLLGGRLRSFSASLLVLSSPAEGFSMDFVVTVDATLFVRCCKPTSCKHKMRARDGAASALQRRRNPAMEYPMLC